jgi:undecaprenyl-diphosphatase
MAIDIQLFQFLHAVAGRSSVLDAGIIFFAEYTAYIFIATFLLFLYSSYFNFKHQVRVFLVSMLSAVIARIGITELIRFLYHRPRPFVALMTNSLFSEISYSFPSGHSTFFFAIAMSVYLYNKKWGVGFFAISIFMNISRIIAGVHYPSDILGGAVIGIGTAYVVWHVVEVYAKRTVT